MITDSAQGFNKQYELLKKRYRDVFQDSEAKARVKIKTLDQINDKSSSNNADLGKGIDELLNEMVLPDDSKRWFQEKYSKVQDHYRDIQYYTKEQILGKAIELKQNPNLDIYLVTALMNKANKIVTGYELRPVQILSALEFFRDSGSLNKFCQVNTGEGKTTLTSMIAVIKALQGDTVDIITSNGVLAEDAVRDRGDFYALFDLSVAHNNLGHGQEKELEASYRHDIVYGTIGNFEFDYLKHRIRLSEVKGSREFGSLIIDEADNVVLDNATHTAKLSGPVAGMEDLKYIYLNIWQKLIKTEKLLGLENTNIDQITPEDKKLIRELMSISVKTIKDSSMIPEFLESYVDRKMDSWINNALRARYDYHEHQSYLIGRKDADLSDPDAEENVIPLDVGIGVTLQNTIWTDLHQFIQIKHNLQVMPDSLSSIFIANSEYIRLYKTVSGLTGTLGSAKERALIKTLYDANSTIIPTYKTGMMKYKTNKLVNDKDWIEEIAKDAIKHAVDKKRAALLVCETVQDARDLAKQLLQNGQAKVLTYMDEHDASKIESINKTGGIEPGTIIIATNIGGRGTDIKLSDTVKANGGLHECTTFMASSSRILKQAFGRAARQGELGSSRIIIKKSDPEKYGINLKDNFLNEDIYDLIDTINDSRISRFIPQIERAEKNFRYFSEFADLYTKNKQLGINYFVLEDLRLQWALAVDEDNTIEIRKVFDRLAEASDSIKDYDHQFMNPYFAIRYVESMLSAGFTGSINENVEGDGNHSDSGEEDELYSKAKRVLNQECVTQDPNLLYAANMKIFEVLISQSQKNKLKQLANGIIVSSVAEHEVDDQVRLYFEDAQKTLTERIKHLQNLIDSEDFHQIVLAKNDLNNNGENCMLQHIGSKYMLLQLQLQNVTNLIAWIDSSKNESLCISGKYSCNELIEYIKDSQKSNNLKLKIYKEELNQSGNSGEDSFYTLNELPDVITNNRSTEESIRAISSSFAKNALNFTFTKSAIPSADDLTDSGIFDIMKVILSVPEDAESKAKDYLSETLSFGFASLVKSLNILHRVSNHVYETISARKSEFSDQIASQITKQQAIFSEKCEKIMPKGLLKLPQRLTQAFDETKALEGSNINTDHDIDGINSYFGKYTLGAIKSILQLRIKDAGINNVKVATDNYSFIDGSNNNISDLFEEMMNMADSSIILAPLSLSNKHAGGLIITKQQSAFKLYYIDSENDKIPSNLAQIFKNQQLDIMQLTAETQKYANCGPEVIENFMFYLTGERLPQEKAIKYHSLLVEQDLINSAANQDKVTACSEDSVSNGLEYADIIGYHSFMDLEISALGVSSDHDSIFDLL